MKYDCAVPDRADLVQLGDTVTVRFTDDPPDVMIIGPDTPTVAANCHARLLPYVTDARNAALPPLFDGDSAKLKSLVRAYTVAPRSFGTSVQFTALPSGSDDSGHDSSAASGVADTSTSTPDTPATPLDSVTAPDVAGHV